MKKPIIAIDIDDVLANTIEAFRIVVNEKSGAELTAEHYSVPGEYHNYFENIWETHGIIDKISVAEVFQQMEKDQSHVLPSEGASKALESIAKGFDLEVVTARDPEWQHATLAWLNVHFPNAFSRIHFAGSKHDPAKKTKGEMCVEIGAAYLIDDHIEHAESALSNGVKAILFGEYGWHINVPTGVVRCKTWKDVERYFDEERSRL